MPGAGFAPTKAFRPTVLQTVAFDYSAILAIQTIALFRLAESRLSREKATKKQTSPIAYRGTAFRQLVECAVVYFNKFSEKFLDKGS